MKNRLTKFFTAFLAVTLLIGMSPATMSTAYAASWNTGFSSWLGSLFGGSKDNSQNNNQNNGQQEDATVNNSNQLQVGANSTEGTAADIKLTKTATDKGKDSDGNQIFDIDLSVKGSEIRTTKKVDIVLIMDASSSMTNALKNMTKKAGISFVNKVFNDTGVDARVAVVSYGNKAYARNYSGNGSWTEYKTYGNYLTDNNYSNNSAAIISAINNAYSATSGSTNTEGAFLISNDLANIKRADAEHLTLFMTDGVPTKHYTTGTSTTGGESYTSKSDYNEALAAAINLGRVSNVYNVALTGGLSRYKYDKIIAQNFMAQPPHEMTQDTNRDTREPKFSSTDSESYAKKYYNITTTNEDDASTQMEDIYIQIASQALSLVQNGVVKDTLPADFKLTDEGKTALEQAEAKIVENSDGTTTITFNNVPAGKEVTNLPTIPVKYVGNGYGAAYTNTEATYSGKITNGSDFNKAFPVPVAGLHPKTVDDTDSTSVGTRIDVDVTYNDLFEKLTVDGYQVSGSTIILTDKYGNPVTYDGDVTATIVDGKLQFKSKTAGTKELYYVVEADITQIGDNFAINGQEKLVSRPTKVTIDVYGAANKAFVVDFGKSVTYSAAQVFDADELKSEISLQENGIGIYGDLKLNDGNSITYKLKKFMDNIDVFTFNEKYNDNVTVDKTVSMVPASSIYYEDSFSDEDGNTLINYGDGWEVLGQDTIPGVKGDGNLGYDSAYDTSDSQLVYSGGTIHYVPKSTSIAKAEFTFTGQGIDLYSYTSGLTGKLTFRVYDKDGTRVFNETTNTKYNSGNVYQVPVITFMGEEAQTYRVEILVPKNNAFYLDAIRIYNSVKVNKDDIGGVDVDNESTAKFVSIREQSLNADLFTVTGDVFIDAYAGNDAKVVAIPNELSEFTTYGRKTEVVVAPGDSITIALKNIKNYSKVELGARIDAAVPSNITGGSATGSVLVNDENILVKSSTDMYYTVKFNNNGQLVITNNTNKLLSLTKLKLVD
ncbi:vWA domain-containing protein [Intestinibacter sp.]